MKTPDALALAQERDLDLVEVAPEARPPVYPHPRLLEVQVRAGPEGQAGAQAPAADHGARDQVPPEDRRARLRHQEAPRRALPAPQGQGQDHDHVPRARGHPPRARHGDPRPSRRGTAGARRRRAAPDAGRAQHDDDDGALEGRPRRAVSTRRGRRRRVGSPTPRARGRRARGRPPKPPQVAEARADGGRRAAERPTAQAAAGPGRAAGSRRGRRGRQQALGGAPADAPPALVP